MSFFLTAGVSLAPAMTMAAGTSTFSGADFAAGLKAAVTAYHDDSTHAGPASVALQQGVETTLARVGELTALPSFSNTELAELAHHLASVHRALLSLQALQGETRAAPAALLAREVQDLVLTLSHCYQLGDEPGLGQEDDTIPGLPLPLLAGVSWSELAEDLCALGQSTVPPLIHGLGAVGLGLGARIALKLETAAWFSALHGAPLAASARTYLYGHTAAYVGQLNQDHAVPAKMGEPDAWVHHGVTAIGFERWKPLRKTALIQVVAIDSTNFIQELRSENYQFFKDLPEGAILVSPIKSELSVEHYREIEADYRVAYRARHQVEAPPVLGGISMEDLYDMVRVITDREDVRTVHVGGEYFAKNLYFHHGEAPHPTELVLASRDLGAAEAVARWLRLPDSLSVTVTDDVFTVLLGGTMKNIVAYALGDDDITTLGAIADDAGAVHDWCDALPAENAYVTEAKELTGARARWWRTYVGIAQDLGRAAEAVTVPREILKDFCGCTIINRRLVAEKFAAIRAAYRAEDWEQFRAAVSDFKEQLPQMANSRNRRGGLIHHLALFIKEQWERPEEARLLFLDQTIEGYKALKGLHDRLQVHGTFARDALGEVFRRFYTRKGVPVHPELDPLVAPSLRHAMSAGLRYEVSGDSERLEIPVARLARVFAMHQLPEESFRFIADQVAVIARLLERGRQGGSVKKEFRLLSRGLELIEEGLAIVSARHEARQTVPPYHNVMHFEVTTRHGAGIPFDHYWIRMAGNPDPARLQDIAILLSHHQGQGHDRRVHVDVTIEGGLTQEAEILQTARAIVERFGDYQEHSVEVTLRYGGTEAKLESPLRALDRPEGWEAQRDRAIAAIARATGAPASQLPRFFMRQTELVRRIVAEGRWTGLIQTGRNQYCNQYSVAFRDALRVPGPKAFYGLFHGAGQRYPEAVIVAYEGLDGQIRFLHGPTLQQIAEAQSPQGRQGALFEGLEVEAFLEAYRRQHEGDEVELRPLEIWQFPPEQILVGLHRDSIRAAEFFAFFNLLDPDRSKGFLTAIESLYYEESDGELAEEIREAMGNPS